MIHIFWVGLDFIAVMLAIHVGLGNVVVFMYMYITELASSL